MSYFWDRCFSYGDAHAICLPTGSVITYARLLHRADKIMEHIQQGSLVVIECENHPDCLAAYLGCLKHRVVPLLVDGALKSTLRKALYEHFLPNAIWSRSIAGSGFEWTMYHQQSPELDPELALLLSTSGSTGSPRLVRLSRQNLQSNAESIVSYLNITSDDRPITSLPMHYSYGLSVINTHLLTGSCLLLTADSIMERSFWTFMKEAGATSFSGVPTMYALLRRLRFERMDLPELRVLTQAGGRLAPESVQWFGELARSRNMKFFAMYGQTEATARISYLPIEFTIAKSGSIGVAIPEGELFLRNTQGERITLAGEVGELVYKGKNVMLGYAETKEELSLGDALHGELATGDLAKQDSDGFFYIVGRLKRFIKIHGNRFGLDEIEERIQKMGITAYVTGRDDLLLIALVDSQADNEIDAVMLATTLTRDYSLHHSVVRVISCSGVPKSSAGKVQYAELLARLEADLEGGVENA